MFLISNRTAALCRAAAHGSTVMVPISDLNAVSGIFECLDRNIPHRQQMQLKVMNKCRLHGKGLSFNQLYTAMARLFALLWNRQIGRKTSGRRYSFG